MRTAASTHLPALDCAAESEALGALGRRWTTLRLTDMQSLKGVVAVEVSVRWIRGISRR